MASIANDKAYDVSDSTDWLQTPLPSLAPVESALQCQVCREFYNTPMITSCSHTFCSLCIRHCLSNGGKCPICRKDDDASKLKNNLVVEELVDAFKIARPNIIEYTKKRPEAVELHSSPKRKRGKGGVDEQNNSPVRKRTRAGRRAQQSSQQVAVIDSEGEDGDYVPEEDQKPAHVLCPMCQDEFPTVQAVEAHVDKCDGEPPSKKQRLRSTQTSLPPQPVSKPLKRPDRLPQLHYGMVKDNVLRRKLTDMGISAGGTRQLMERRYTEWITLWNSNCDSKNPKSKSELKRELDVWERTQGGGALAPSRTPGSNIRDKQFDGPAWSEKHDDSFRQLITEARKRKAAKTEALEAASKTEAPSGSVTPTYETPQPGPYGPPCPSAAPPASKQQQPNEDLPPVKVRTAASETPSDLIQSQEPRSEVVPASPPRSNSQRRFFEGITAPLPLNPPPSSQPQPQPTQMLDRDIDMNPNLGSVRSLQP